MRIAMFFLMTLMGLTGCSPHSDAVSGVTMSARLVNEHDDVAIRFEITNRTSEPLVVIDRFLPWGGNAANWGDDAALVMRAVGSQGRELPKLYPVRELGPDATATISPGETVAGTLRPSHYFADLSEALEYGNVTIFWTYRLNPVGGGEVTFRNTIELSQR